MAQLEGCLLGKPDDLSLTQNRKWEGTSSWELVLWPPDVGHSTHVPSLTCIQQQEYYYYFLKLPLKLSSLSI